MKFKLDENLGSRGAIALRDAGHDVATVADQQMTSAPDASLIELCAHEERCLVTLDLDFASPIRFPPQKYAGIVVLRPNRRPTRDELDELVATLVAALSRPEVAGDRMSGKLWILSPGRIREYSPL